MARGGCKAIVIRCSDGRLNKPINEFLVSRGLEDSDIVAYPGSARKFAEPADGAMEDIITLKKAHHPQELWIINHTDCAKYGGSEAFASKADEENKHLDDLRNARQKIEGMIPDLRVRTAIARINPEGIHIKECE